MTSHNALVFILGREPHLSVAEIAAVLGDRAAWASAELSREALLLHGAPPPLQEGEPPALRSFSEAGEGEASVLMTRLAGTQKIAHVWRDVPRDARGVTACVEAVAQCIAAHTTTERKARFGFSVYDFGAGEREVERLRHALQRSAREMKEVLIAGGRKARNVTSRAATLASVTVSEQKLLPKDNGVEVVVLIARDRFVVCRTLAVQPFKEWSYRDYGRPRRDARSGMLPPKLARMMVNLARAPADGVLLDPFCGSGTVLMEATLLGIPRVIGTDTSSTAIADTRENMAWIARVVARFSPSHREGEPEGVGGVPSVVIEHCDVRSLSSCVRVRVDAIVTEPYLGPSTERVASTSIARELHDLYLVSFRAFARALAPDGRVVFILPDLRAGRVVTLSRDAFVADVRALGFVPVMPFPQELRNHPVLRGKEDLPYARAGQRVARRVLVFKRS